MYVILKHKAGDAKDEIVFVQAKKIEDAKRMAGVPDSTVEWGVLDTSLISGFCDVKEGYFVIGF